MVSKQRIRNKRKGQLAAPSLREQKLFKMNAIGEYEIHEDSSLKRYYDSQSEMVEHSNIHDLEYPLQYRRQYYGPVTSA